MIEKIHPLNIRADLKHFLFSKILKAWQQYAYDFNQGGFYERLDGQFKPINCGYKRLLTQCRQIYVFSHAYLLTGNQGNKHLASLGYEFVTQNFWDSQHGGWYHKVNDNGGLLSKEKDLYSHAFFLFASAYYYKVSKDSSVLENIYKTIDIYHLNSSSMGLNLSNSFQELINNKTKFDKEVRRQNPYMHLLEAFLALYAMIGDALFLAEAQKIILLLKKHFYHAETQTLRECFTSSWSIHPDHGHIVEPGHHFEWVWLIDWYLELTSLDDKELKLISKGLFQWALDFGVDQEIGGVFDQMDGNTKKILSFNKRIWPTLEMLKALKVGEKTENDSDLMTKKVNLLMTFFFQKDSGSWFEYLDRDLKPMNTDMPGTTLYHILLALSHVILHFTQPLNLHE